MKRLVFLAIVPIVGLLVACGGGGAPAPTPARTPTPAATPARTPTPTAAPFPAPTVAAPYKGVKSPFTLADTKAIDAGKAIYTAQCVACHGEKGDGKGPVGQALKPAPPDFSDPEQLSHFETYQDHHFWSISEGVAGTAMPAFKGTLSEEQRWQVFVYEWSLGKQR